MLTVITSAFGQQYEFVRDGGGFRMIEKQISMPLIVEDQRPLWKRMLYSLRPWTMASPGTRMTYDEAKQIYDLKGSVGVGVRGKVEF